MEIVYRIIDYYVNPAIFVLFSLAVILFIVGLYRTWITSGDGYEQRKAGGRHLLYGLLGMLIMGCVFAIMSFVKSSVDEFTGTTDNGPKIETIPVQQ